MTNFCNSNDKQRTVESKRVEWVAVTHLKQKKMVIQYYHLIKVRHNIGSRISGLGVQRSHARLKDLGSIPHGGVVDLHYDW